ncbi:putative type IV pilin [Fibrobacter succinogenes subsp. succinogenes S85]|uniref:Type IV pilin n=1 Tax=Fibrobacter succinogenes (strain ATCC 19169 / S85) TaxID=59374 RepID=A7UG50_FIBSS|nr:type II secretion system protein [Fibrobacter succinogenes]ABU45481.1 type IV pilin [Fibrobacter succinogenes subsp. succinogenes S85]ACX75628.1 hypothetical protein Fisuc_2041 [Fibrobacter succinogenes subsp. succinogenes S85]ADL25959.1 putative type IV pilin [Fibrobacter succinogenes subsp. succinogenes S85]
MKKQGFTLIELMVVIVIMGILAAVAVPKLFGMIAKSKASEVGPAAGTYVKLQDAYVAESGVYVGNWKTIGYNMPGSNNFTYAEKDLTANTTTLAGLSAKVGWKATNNSKLNDCVKDSEWDISISEAGTDDASKGSPIAYSATTPSKSGDDDTSDCAALTPNFTKIGK